MSEKKVSKLELAVSCLKELKELISEDEHLSTLNFDDEFLLRFVRSRKYDSKVAFKTVQKYYKVREQYPEIFEHLKPNEQKHSFDSTIIGFLKHRDVNGRKVYFGRSEPWDVKAYPFDDLLASSILLIEEAIQSEETQENGVVLVFDYHKFSFAQFLALGPSQVRKVVSILIEGYPMKVKQIYCVNATRVFYWSYAIIKNLCSKKLRDRIIVDQGVESVHSIMSPDLLPEWLRGTLSYDESIDLDMLKQVYEKQTNL